MKLSKLGKAAMSGMMLDLAVTPGAEYASVRGATFVLPESLPELGTAQRLAAVLDIPPVKLEEMTLRTSQWDGPEAVGGVDLRDYVPGEAAVRELPVKIVIGGTTLTPMVDADGGLELVDKSWLAPVADELASSEYISWTARRTAGGQKYYAIKDGFWVKALLLPYMTDKTELAATLEEMAAGLRGGRP